MNLEVDPGFISKVEELRETKLTVKWINTIIMKIKANKSDFFQDIENTGSYNLVYNKIVDRFPDKYKIRNKIATTLREKYKLNLTFEPDSKYSILLISLYTRRKD